jgi:hypothetical protein
MRLSIVRYAVLAWAGLGLAGAAFAQAPNAPPQQVNVSVKVVEFQTNEGFETGLSAYLAQVSRPKPYGGVTTPSGAVNSADITFPSSSAAGLTVFLDDIIWDDYNLELVLQALKNEDRAFILSRPKALVPVGTETTLKTVVKVPYENTLVVGNTPVQTADFRDTGVNLVVTPTQVVDDDGNWTTTSDTYIHLDVTAEVRELGQRIVIHLDERLAGGADFSLARNAITAPEFISRSMKTSVWVRHGQVLVLGGLYRNTKSKDLDTLPWLLEAEDTLVGVAERFLPGNFLGSPLSATIGNRASHAGRRELVFLIKAEAWRPAYTVAETHGFVEADSPKGKISPTEVISDVIQGITDVPKGIAEGLSGQPIEGKGVQGDLGGME